MEHSQRYGSSSRGDHWYDEDAYDAGPPGERGDEPWADTRTSVFDLPVYDDPPMSYDPAVSYDPAGYDDPAVSYDPAGYDDPAVYDHPAGYDDPAGYDSPDPGVPGEEVRETSTIDSDPFAGRSSLLRRRYGEHYRRDEPLHVADGEDDDVHRTAVVHRLVIAGVAAAVLVLLGAYAFLAGEGGGDGDTASEGALPSTTEAGDISTSSAPTTQAPDTSTTSGPAAPAAPRPPPSAPSTPSTTAPASATPPPTTAPAGNAAPTNPPPTTAPSGGTSGGSGNSDGDRPDEDNDTLLEMLGLG